MVGVTPRIASTRVSGVLFLPCGRRQSFVSVRTLPSDSSPQPADCSDPNRVISAYLELLHPKFTAFHSSLKRLVSVALVVNSIATAAWELPTGLFYGAPTFLEVVLHYVAIV